MTREEKISTPKFLPDENAIGLQESLPCPARTLAECSQVFH